MTTDQSHFLTDIPCVILAGGQARRFGTPKGLARLNGRTLLDHICECLRSQTKGDIVLNASLDGPYTNQGLDLVPDTEFIGDGPLSGLRTAMHYAQAQGHSSVITVPVDTPFLPQNLVETLSTYDGPVIAKSEGQAHPVCGLWPTDLLKPLKIFLMSGQRSAHAWVRACEAKAADFTPAGGIDPFFNINTQEDLVLAASQTRKQTPR